MIQHTIILETYKKNIPLKVDLDYVTNLIIKDRPIVEYFGIELDNDADYINTNMQMKFVRTTTIVINFESTDEINYDKYSRDEIFDLISKYFSLTMKSEVRIESDEKDITIYL